MILNLTLEINCIFSVLIIVSEIYDLDKQEREEMEFVDGRETRRRDKGEDAMSTPPPLPSFVTITTIAISPIPNRSSPPPWLLRSVFTGVATTSVTLVTSFFLSERVNLLSFSPTSWWSQREIVEKMIEMIDSGFDCGNVICARYDKTLFLGKQRQQVWTSSMTSQMMYENRGLSRRWQRNLAVVV
ncbi:hypothetical protein HID58_086312 [Brassica napus]|uniref:Uncharacterized protein n=2 Tax=Brassica TaxID=3705 RepID=A0ABQ7XQA5_BRANA|nr:hypothetical protein HID58_086312 [Brassica napus]